MFPLNVISQIVKLHSCQERREGKGRETCTITDNKATLLPGKKRREREGNNLDYLPQTLILHTGNSHGSPGFRSLYYCSPLQDFLFKFGLLRPFSMDKSSRRTLPSQYNLYMVYAYNVGFMYCNILHLFHIGNWVPNMILVGIRAATPIKCHGVSRCNSLRRSC